MVLSNDDKVLIFMRRAVGYTQQEIADELGCTQRTICYQLKKSKALSDKVGVDTALKLLFSKVMGHKVAEGIVMILRSDFYENRKER